MNGWIGLASVSTAGLVGALTWGTARVLTRSYRRYRDVYLGQTTLDLGALFVFIEPRQIWPLSLAATLLFGLIGGWLLGAIAAIAGISLGLVLPGFWVLAYRRHRIARLESQLPDTLLSVASGLKAGSSFSQALEWVAQETPAPLGQELRLWVREVRLGVSVDEAWTKMAKRVGSPELEQVASAILIARSVGGNGAELLDALGAAIRERLQLRGRVDSLTAQGRLQGWVLAAMPLLVGAVLNSMRPDLIGPMMRHPLGLGLFTAVAVLQLSGLWVIRRMTDVRP